MGWIYVYWGHIKGGSIHTDGDRRVAEAVCLIRRELPGLGEQSNGMLQYVVWTALSDEGVGASIQHYNPLIDEEMRKEWGVPESWKLIAQMPFGNIEAPAGDKEFGPIDNRMKVFN
ncbi:hypothetical protein POTG_00478 [Paenibacillus sp. oral taxon 786 str. D14]|nr:hypothetical protein POTG_00478 [Paenibacillus sp. oral taxon 786 str. D14]